MNKHSKMLEILKASKIFPNQRLPSHFLEIEGKVSVVCIPGKGRGLFAKQVFNPGDLIIGHRALEIIFPDSAATVPSSILLSRVKRFRCLKESLAKLASTDEEVRRKLYFLHAGPKLGFVGGDEREVKKSISLARIEGWVIKNFFYLRKFLLQNLSIFRGHPGQWVSRSEHTRG